MKLKVPFTKKQSGCRFKILALAVFFCASGEAKAQQNADSSNVSKNVYMPFAEMDSHYRYLIALQKKRDSLKFERRHTIVIGVRFGKFLVPDYVQTARDSITGTDLAAQHNQWTLYAEYYTSPHWSLGLDFSIHGVKQVQKVTSSSNGVNIKASGGINFNILVNCKYIWRSAGNAVRNPSLTYKDHWMEIVDKLSELDAVNSRKMRKIRLYNMFGGGITQTILLKVRGNPSVSLSKSSYKQAVPTIFAGVGAISHFSRNMSADLGCRYVLSKAFNPAMEKVKSYSGFNIQFSVGILFNTKYQREKNNLINNSSF